MRTYPCVFGRGRELMVAAAVGEGHRVAHGHGLADRASDPGPGLRGVDDEVARGEDIRHVVAILDRRSAVRDSPLTRVSTHFSALARVATADQREMHVRM